MRKDRSAKIGCGGFIEFGSDWLPERGEKADFSRVADDVCGALQGGYTPQEIAEEMGWRPCVLSRFIRKRGLTSGEVELN